MKLELEIQATSAEGFLRYRRSVEMPVVPAVGDRIGVEFWADGVRVRSRIFTVDGEVVLDLGWHRLDSSELEGLADAGWREFTKHRSQSG